MVVRNVLGGEHSVGGERKKASSLGIPRELFFTQRKALRFTSTVGCCKLGRLGHACSKIKNTITKYITIAVIVSPM